MSGREPLGPGQLQRRPQARGVLIFEASGTKWPRWWKSLLQSRSPTTTESAPQPLATYVTTGAWWRCLPALNLCNFVLECDHGSHSEVCLERPPACFFAPTATPTQSLSCCARSGQKRLGGKKRLAPASLIPYPCSQICLKKPFKATVISFVMVLGGGAPFEYAEPMRG